MHIFPSQLSHCFQLKEPTTPSNSKTRLSSPICNHKSIKIQFFSFVPTTYLKAKPLNISRNPSISLSSLLHIFPTTKQYTNLKKSNIEHKKLPIENTPLEAMLTCGDNQGDNCWYPDLGATNHITNDFENMAYGLDYNGTQKVHMGNGTGLSIEHIVNSYISCSKSSKSLTLKNILHIPKITKNLLSISRFTKDNNLLFEFNSSSCFGKDKVSKTTLLQGVLHKGLYRFDLRDERKNAFG
ncbi:hypothetical protein UlMin_015596 [Ulmus minor]